ncbi:hypothetical protein SteCoe_10921 [Stentor coeruleus]|uniref:non-specific serine/threonine protein kinase n=1 Tax=Stentor coeruleus TaxID=5963 RepID=A0A1R2CEI0_9CILI|nr:hypothetical protein SteCoe_10921 [Stentor coeruleus]
MEGTFSLLDGFEVLRTLDFGQTSKVKIVRDASTKQNYAAKILRPKDNIIPQTFQNSMQTEFQILSVISHPSIARVLNYNTNGIYQSKKKPTYQCIYILMELYPYGNLFNLISQDALSMQVIRMYFIDILNGLSACHTLGIAHRDIKPENLLFDKNCNIIIADFGLAGISQGRNDDGFMRTRSSFYMAPEVLLGLPFNGQKADIFSLGVTLFVMYSRFPPFYKADTIDRFYKSFINDNDKFWEYVSSRHHPGFYTHEFIDLINKMLIHDPNRRITIDEIREHPWFSGPMSNIADVAESIKKAINLIRIKAETAMNRPNNGNVTFREGRYYRCEADDSSSLSFEILSRDCAFKDFYEEAEVFRYGSVVLGISLKDIYAILYNELCSNNAEIIVNENFNDIIAVNYSGYGDTKFRIRVYKKKDGLKVLDFALIEGSNFDLMVIVNSIASKMLEFQNYVNQDENIANS